jgi:transcriptional regulator with XRE-family HTH domain
MAGVGIRVAPWLSPLHEQKETIMTLGSKLRAARQEANLTQQQLATKLMVSRQAITKWEADAGIPDIENLKALAALFGVSVDYLVAGDEPVSGAVLIEPVDLRDYTPRRRARLLAIEARYPDAASIDEVLRTVRRSWWAWLVELVMPAEFLRGIDAVDKYAAHFLVTVTKDQLESRELSTRWDGDGHFVVGDDKYWLAKKTLSNGWTV